MGFFDFLKSKKKKDSSSNGISFNPNIDKELKKKKKKEKKEKSVKVKTEKPKVIKKDKVVKKEKNNSKEDKKNIQIETDNKKVKKVKGKVVKKEIPKKEDNVKKFSLKEDVFEVHLDEKVVFNTEKEIEDYYRKEKEKAKDLLNQIEKEKASSLINIAKRQFEEVRLEKESLDKIHKDLSEHLKNILGKIKEINSEKEKNKDNIELVEKLRKSFRNLEKEAGGIIVVRKSLLAKENLIIQKMNELAENSEDKLKVSDNEDSVKLIELEREKQNLIKESKDLLNEEGSKMKLDENLFDAIDKNAVSRIKILNKEFSEVRKEKVDILKKRHILKISEEKARDQLKESLKKIEDLKKRYKKVLGLK